LIDRKAYFLLCRLQEVKFGYEDNGINDDEKFKMFTLTLDWMVNQKRAIKLIQKPTHLIIKFKDD